MVEIKKEDQLLSLLRKERESNSITYSKMGEMINSRFDAARDRLSGDVKISIKELLIWLDYFEYEMVVRKKK